MGRVLHASYSGYFPSCIGAARTVGVVSGSLSKIMEIYWRIKTWEISSATGAVIFPIDEDDSITYTFTEGTKELGSTDATTEEELVCTKYFNKTALIQTVVTNTLAPPPSSIFTTFGLTYFPTASKSGSNYQMSFIGFISSVGTDLVSTTKEGPIVGYISLSPLDISVPLRADSAEASGNVSVSLNATEWWSYGGLYDTATGELT
jgi:hypothetical protein